MEVTLNPVLFTLLITLSLLFIACDNSIRCDGYFPNRHEGLCWSDNFSSNETTWGDAKLHCAMIGGRLPTISELRTLIQNCPVTEIGGACGITDSCLADSCYSFSCKGCSGLDDGSYSVFGDKEALWADSLDETDPIYAFYVYFFYGSVSGGHKTNDYGKMRCVRG